MVRKMVERQCWIMHIVNRVNKADTHNTVFFVCFFNLRRKATWESFYHYFLQTLKRKEKKNHKLPWLQEYQMKDLMTFDVYESFTFLCSTEAPEVSREHSVLFFAL